MRGQEGHTPDHPMGEAWWAYPCDHHRLFYPSLLQGYNSADMVFKYICFPTAELSEHEMELRLGI